MEALTALDTLLNQTHVQSGECPHRACVRTRAIEPRRSCSEMARPAGSEIDDSRRIGAGDVMVGVYEGGG